MISDIIWILILPFRQRCGCSHQAGTRLPFLVRHRNVSQSFQAICHTRPEAGLPRHLQTLLEAEFRFLIFTALESDLAEVIECKTYLHTGTYLFGKPEPLLKELTGSHHITLQHGNDAEVPYR